MPARAQQLLAFGAQLFHLLRLCLQLGDFCPELLQLGKIPAQPLEFLMRGLQALIFRVVAAQLFEVLRRRLQRCVFVFQLGDLIGLHRDGQDAGEENGGKGDGRKPAADQRRRFR